MPRLGIPPADGPKHRLNLVKHNNRQVRVYTPARPLARQSDTFPSVFDPSRNPTAHPLPQPLATSLPPLSPTPTNRAPLPTINPMKIALLLPAAGASTRYSTAGGERSKLDEDLGGRPVLHRTLDTFINYTNPDAEFGHFAVAGPANNEAFESFNIRHADTLALLGISLIRGGADHRFQSVQALLQTVPESATHIAVHDAARPCLSHELLDRLLAAARHHPAVIPGIPLTDTLKQAAPEPLEDEQPDPLAAILGPESSPQSHVWPIERTLPRESLWLVQTPQIFEADLLRRAYQQPDLSSTDDAQLVERIGSPVVIVEGQPENLKITRPLDLQIARAILGVRPPSSRPSHKRF